MIVWRHILCLGFLAIFSCQSKKKEIVYEEEVFDEVILTSSVGFTRLSEYGFFEGQLNQLIPAKQVFPYELNAPLFSDYASKKRFIYFPEGTAAAYHSSEVLQFPVGTVLIKNFYYSDDQLASGKGKILETRLLIHEEEGWKALPYIWNEAQTDATLEITGGVQEVLLTGKKPFKYAVPNMAQCKGCHEVNGQMSPIGPSARQLNRLNDYDGKSHNQLSFLSDSGLLMDMPGIEQVPKLANYEMTRSESLEARSRAYLEANCAHCHRKEGPAKNSGLYLLTSNQNQDEVGVMKAPVAAGKGSANLKFDIVPGKPGESILLHRMNSIEPEVMMPELGRKLIHQEGVELVREWIASMEN